MIQARLNIKYGFTDKLSLNHILHCSVTNQGCDGGYSYLVSKFGSEMELITENCEDEKDFVKIFKVNFLVW